METLKLSQQWILTLRSSRMRIHVFCCKGTKVSSFSVQHRRYKWGIPQTIWYLCTMLHAITAYITTVLALLCSFSDFATRRLLRCLIKQDRQFSYNVTMRRVLATNFAVENQYALHTLSMCL